MVKPDIYKAYDEVFDNKKMRKIKNTLKTINSKVDNINTFHIKKIQAYMLYCKELLIDKDNTKEYKSFRISYNKGIEKQDWNDDWNKLSPNEHDVNLYVEFATYIQNDLTEEGQKMFNAIQSFDTTITIPNKRYKMGTIQPHHKEYYSLPSYSHGRNDYPVNLIFKNFYGKMNISIPAFHRYPITSEWINDAESLKRQMVLVEYYDEITEHLNPIAKDINKQYNALGTEKEKLNKITAKYELLINI